MIGNRVIGDVYGMMKPVILQIMASHKTRRTFETGTFREHEAIVEALAARDRIAYQYRLQSPPRSQLPALRGGRGRSLKPTCRKGGTFPGEED